MKQEIGNTEIIHFDSEAMLFKHIGRNQIDSETVALTEIVKNSYDADATEVNIFFDKPENVGGEIIVTDNGHGMSKEEFCKYWMRPGTPHKESENRSPKWRRVMLGRKGMGRFGTDKIGELVVIKGKTTSDHSAFVAKIDAAKFEQAGTKFEEVPVELRKFPKSELTFVLKDYDQGTEVRMKHLRKKWTQPMIKEVRDELAKMISPDKKNSNFSISFEVHNNSDLTGKLENNLSKEFTHELLVKIDQYDSFTIKLNNKVVKAGNVIPETKKAINENDSAFALSTEDISYIKSFGPLDARILYFGNGGLVFRTTGKHGKRVDHSGIKIYRSGFRVLPYGERGDDWLKIKSKRSSRGGKFYIISDKITGFINIDSDTNSHLEDTTNRQGLIDNDEKRTFAAFFSEVVIEELNHYLEKEQAVQKEEDRKKRYQNISRQVSDILSSLTSEQIQKVVTENNMRKSAEARKVVLESELSKDGTIENRKTREKINDSKVKKISEKEEHKKYEKRKRVLHPTDRFVVRPIDAWIEGTRWIVTPQNEPSSELEAWVDEDNQEFIYNTGHPMFIASESSDKAIGKTTEYGSGIAVQVHIHKSIALAWGDFHETKERGTFWERYNEYILLAADIIKKNSKFVEEIPDEDLEPIENEIVSA